MRLKTGLLLRVCIISAVVIVFTQVFTSVFVENKSLNESDKTLSTDLEPSGNVGHRDAGGVEESPQEKSPKVVIVKRTLNVKRDTELANAIQNDFEEPKNVFVKPNSQPTELDDVFISVKTTKAFHRDRLDLILKTWWIFARDQTYFFTDAEDEEYQTKTRKHLINTLCPSVHNRRALCCKMSVEYDYFISSNKRWFCHVDDDTYVNVPELVSLLQGYNHTADCYLGKPSLAHPLEIKDPDHPGQKLAFRFATGGAGMCISRGLALKMMPYTAGGKLKSVCDKIRLPDDCTIGYIIEGYLKKRMTVIPQFHSHLEGLWTINERNLANQVTLSYGIFRGRKKNVVDVGGIDTNIDPTRILSVHCKLHPYLKDCEKLLNATALSSHKTNQL